MAYMAIHHIYGNMYHPHPDLRGGLHRWSLPGKPSCSVDLYVYTHQRIPRNTDITNENKHWQKPSGLLRGNAWHIIIGHPGCHGCGCAWDLPVHIPEKHTALPLSESFFAARSAHPPHSII